MKNDWILGVSRAETAHKVEQNAAETKPLDIRLELDDDGKLSLVMDGERVSEVDLGVLMKKSSKKSLNERSTTR